MPKITLKSTSHGPEQQLELAVVGLDDVVEVLHLPVPRLVRAFTLGFQLCDGAGVASLEEQMRQALEGWSLRPVVEALIALRGVDLITAMTVLAELGDPPMASRRLVAASVPW